jgi:hypothetical protein
LDKVGGDRRGSGSVLASDVGQDVGDLRVRETGHGGHGNGVGSTIGDAGDLDGAGEAVEDDPDEILRVAADPFAAGERGIDAGEALALGLVAREAALLVDFEAGIPGFGGSTGEIAKVLEARVVAAGLQGAGREGWGPPRLEGASALAGGVLEEGVLGLFEGSGDHRDRVDSGGVGGGDNGFEAHTRLGIACGLAQEFETVREAVGPHAGDACGVGADAWILGGEESAEEFWAGCFVGFVDADEFEQDMFEARGGSRQGSQPSVGSGDRSGAGGVKEEALGLVAGPAFG